MLVMMALMRSDAPLLVSPPSSTRHVLLLCVAGVIESASQPASQPASFDRPITQLLPLNIHVQAVLALATALEQFMNGFLAIRLPTVYIRWRFVLYAFNIMWSMIMANLLVYRLHFNYCRSTGGALFWAGELVNTSLPWLCLHGLVFPLPFHHALIVNGVSPSHKISRTFCGSYHICAPLRSS